MPESDKKELIRLEDTDAVTTDEDGTTRVKMSHIDKSGMAPDDFY